MRPTPNWEAGTQPDLALVDEVHVWRAELDRQGWPSASALPAEERRRAARLPRPGTQRRWLASRWALREVLGRYLDEDPAGVELRVGKHGKPALADPSATLRFNLSHSGGLALIALSRGSEIGIDVERIDPRRDVLSLANRALAPAAAANVRAAAPGDRPAVFHAAWTDREAVAKCLGVGLRSSLPATQVTVSALDPGPGFAAALALAAEALPPLRLFALRAEWHRCSGHRLPACAPR